MWFCALWLSMTIRIIRRRTGWWITLSDDPERYIAGPFTSRARAQAWKRSLSSMTPHQERVIAHYAAGNSLRECAKAFGITFQRVHDIITSCRPDLLRRRYDTRQNSTALSSSQRAAQQSLLHSH